MSPSLEPNVQNHAGKSTFNPNSSLSENKPRVYYIGYTFTKHPVEHVGHKETWAIVNKVLMPASQADLKIQIDKHCKNGVTGLDQYNDPSMKGFKRKQVDKLIRECVVMEPDPRFEYMIASIRLDASGLVTSTMDVIVKRQLRQLRIAINTQEGFVRGDKLRLPSNGNVDLTYEYHYNLTREANSLSSGSPQSDMGSQLSELCAQALRSS